jgi:tryptophan-rich sensory protein
MSDTAISGNPTKSPAKSAVVLAGLLAITFCAPAMGAFGMPGEWYAGLEKPSWNPPSWVFGPVWTFLYISMAVAAWLVWKKGGWKSQRRPLTLYLVQLLLNAIWTPLFFGLHLPGWAFLEILLLLAAVVATMLAFWKTRRPAGALFVPYVLWVSFASVLNGTLWWLNRG